MARQARVAARVEIARIDRELRDLGALRPEESGSRDEYELRVEARDTMLDESLATRPDSDMDRQIALYTEREVETCDSEGDYGLRV